MGNDLILYFSGRKDSPSFPRSADLRLERLCGHVTESRLWPSVFTRELEILKKGEIAGVHALDRARVDGNDLAEPSDHARQQDDDVIAGIGLHARIFQGASSSQAVASRITPSQ